MNVLTFREFIEVIRKKWIFISLSTFIALFLSAYLSFYIITPTYSNASTILVNDRNQTNNTLTFNDIMLYEKLMGTYKDVIVSKRILKEVLEQYLAQTNSDYPANPEELARIVSITTNPSSQVIRITVNHRDYQSATTLANLISDVFSSNLPDIMTINNVQILDPAELAPNPMPVTPNKTLNIVIALILGLFLSVCYVILVAMLDTRVRRDEDLSNLIGYPILGTIPAMQTSRRKRSWLRL
jgi:capsular polysaccharide biosynthesis protein